MTEPLIICRPCDGDAPTDIVGFTATLDGTGDVGRVARDVSLVVAGAERLP